MSEIHDDPERSKLKSILHEVLNERDALDHETHRKQHAWIAAQIEKDIAKKERIEDLKKKVIGFLILSALTLIGKGLLIVYSLAMAGLNVKSGQPPSPPT